MRRILLSYWDGGNCHLVRVLSLAKELGKAGHKLALITSSKNKNFINRLGFYGVIFVIENRKSTIHTPPYEIPIYSHAYRHSQRLIGLEFNDIDFLHKVIKEEISAIRNFKPHLIINDYRDTIRTSAEVTGTPIIGIVTTNGHSKGFGMGFWNLPPEDLELPDCLPYFNEVRRYYDLPGFTDERQLFEGELNLIPSSPLVDPLFEPDDQTVYTGPLSNSIKDSLPLSTATTSHKTVFSYLGENNGRPRWHYEELLIELVCCANIKLYVSGSISHFPLLYNMMQTNSRIIIKPFFSGDEYISIIRNSSVVITQGGSTSLIALFYGIPVLFIPWNTEPVMAQFIKKLGAGTIIQHSQEPLTRVSAPDLGKNIDIFGYWQSNISKKEFIDSILNLMENEAREKAQNISTSLRKIRKEFNINEFILGNI